jgi:hypothetical protein
VRVSVFYPHSLYSAWSVSMGLVDELRRMGHDVSDCGIVPNPEVPLKRSRYPKPEELKDYDLILVSGPEHLRPYIAALYPNFAKVKTKKIAYWHETVNRSDYGQLPYRDINAPFDAVFTPAVQDQELGMSWLPFGVDTGMFFPGACGFCLGTGSDLNNDAEEVETCKHCSGTKVTTQEPPKEYDACFIGLMYQKRIDFLKKNQIENLKIGNVQVVDFNGFNSRLTAQLYANELFKMKVLVNLPSLCEHVVTKVTEAMAAGTAVVTPFMEGVGRENFKMFENGKDLLYYSENPKGLIESLLNDAEFRGRLAMQGCKEVHEKHSLRKRLEVILGD